MNVFPLLSTILFLPLAGGVLALALRTSDRARGMCLATAGAEVLLLVALPFLFTGPQGLALNEEYAWIPQLHARYSLGLDGLSYLLALLTALLGFLGMLASRRENHGQGGVFNVLVLTSVSAAMGVFLARDLLLFFLFWEVQLVPMFLLIRRFGLEERRRAAMKFLVFNLAGSLPMVLAVVDLLLTRQNLAPTALAALPPGPGLQGWLAAAFLLAFAVKTPVIPLHTWLPDAYTQAPTAGSLLLAGVLSKTGVYAILRWGLPLFPHAAVIAAPWLVWLGVAGLLYASWIALAQTDLKRLLAYASLGHMGLILVGLAVGGVLAASGAAVQMLSHGVTTGALFLMAGMLAQRTGTYELAAFGGVWKRMPVFGAFFLFFCVATAGLPGLSNFVGEVLILVGAFQVRPVPAAVAFVGVVVVLAYVLRMMQSTLFGPEHGLPAAAPVSGETQDLCAREILILSIMALAVLAIGLHPAPILDLLRESITLLSAGQPS